MFKLIKSLLLAAILLSFFWLSPSNAQTTEQITLFKSTVELEKDTDIKIVEEIHYFLPTYKYGIIREIPVDYKVQAGFKRPTTLSLNEIYYYEKDFPSRKFTQYERSSNSGYTIFKIGDPESTIQGEYVYVISYTLKNAINYFDSHDELYLNITGNGWSVPIIQAYAEIKVPGKITEKICYTGITGSTISDCTFEDINEEELKVVVNNPLATYEGYTVAVKMPKGTLDDTSNRQRLAFLLSNLGVLLPIPVFIFLNSIVKKKGKNKKITIIPHYKPEKEIYPLVAGYIYNKVLSSKHITAEIIQLAIDGYIKIKQEGRKDYILVKSSSKKEIQSEIPQLLLDGLFKEKEEINTKKISSDFYLTVRNLNSKINSEMYTVGYFSKDRKKLKNIFLISGIIAFSLSFILITPLSFLAAGGWVFGLLISSSLVFISSFRIDIRSEKGNKSYYELEGLKMYINTAEKHRIEFHDNPDKYRGVFETLLPYAIIFGLEKKWAKEFEDIYKEPPSWYEGDMTAFNSYVLANSISGISKNVQSRSMPPNSAGGFSSSHGASGGSGFSGGSSGGGFGGGGGGSW